MSHHNPSGSGSNQERISRRTMSARALTAGIAVPAAGLIGAAGAAAQATPQTGTDRTAINPGAMFSGAIVANGFVFTSGMLAIDPETGELTGDDITAQTELVMANLEATLTAAGSSLDRVVKATCFLASLEDFQAFNEAYIQAFPSEPPARSTVEVAALALGALVEVDLIATI
jgi:2-iminobutanoate/2-iminopropanoate deaminase